MKYGGEMVTVDNKRYTITNVPVTENEARKRLLAGTQSSNQRVLAKGTSK